MNEEEHTFILHWLGGDKTEVRGPTIQDACNRAGYGAGAMRALDYWEEVKDEPKEGEKS